MYDQWYQWCIHFIYMIYTWYIYIYTGTWYSCSICFSRNLLFFLVSLWWSQDLVVSPEGAYWKWRPGRVQVAPARARSKPGHWERFKILWRELDGEKYAWKKGEPYDLSMVLVCLIVWNRVGCLIPNFEPPNSSRLIGMCLSKIV